jgi:hypothetical protein
VAFTDTMHWEQGNLKVTGKTTDLSLKNLFFALDSINQGLWNTNSYLATTLMLFG